jgi:hypothetical protein
MTYVCTKSICALFVLNINFTMILSCTFVSKIKKKLKISLLRGVIYILARKKYKKYTYTQIMIFVKATFTNPIEDEEFPKYFSLFLCHF